MRLKALETHSRAPCCHGRLAVSHRELWRRDSGRWVEWLQLREYWIWRVNRTQTCGNVAVLNSGDEWGWIDPGGLEARLQWRQRSRRELCKHHPAIGRKWASEGGEMKRKRGEEKKRTKARVESISWGNQKLKGSPLKNVWFLHSCWGYSWFPLWVCT